MVHKLKQAQWKEIQQLLKDPDCSITEIAKKYKIARKTIYSKAWNHGWIVKKKDSKVRKGKSTTALKIADWIFGKKDDK